jgi:hypothetical protein
MPQPLFRTDDAEKWGDGKGSRLSSQEVDLNFWGLHRRIEDIEENPPAATGIEAIENEAPGVATFYLTDGTHYNVPLPVAGLHYRGLWEPEFPYDRLDLFSVERVGLFMVLKTHISGTTFNPLAQDEEFDSLYRQLSGAPADIAYDVALDVFGPIPGDGKPLLKFLANRSFILPAGLIGSEAHLAKAVDANMSLPIKKNADTIGSVVFTPGANLDGSGGQFGTFSFASSVTFALRDRLTIQAPSSQDAEAEDLTVTIAGIRGDV